MNIKRQRTVIATFGCLAILVSGCVEDTSIRRYSIAKAKLADSQSQSGKPAQLLGVIVPHEESAWFFKMTDEPEKVQRLTNDFRELAGSLKFGEDGAPQWRLAKGWEARVLNQITYAQFSSSEGTLVTLTKLGADTKDPAKWQVYLKDNINRWRQQLGLSPQEWSDIEPELEEVPTHSTKSAKAYFVSLVGKQSAAGGGMREAFPPTASQGPIAGASNSISSASNNDHPPTSDPSRPRLAYKVPDGWQEQPASGIRLASFQIHAESDVATVSVSTAGGQLQQAVSMWMQQVGLQPSQELVKRIIEDSISGESTLGQFRCYTIHGTAQEESIPAMTIRVAVIPIDEQESLFVKLTGTTDVVAAETQRFDAFVQSLTWQ